MSSKDNAVTIAVDVALAAVTPFEQEWCGDPYGCEEQIWRDVDAELASQNHPRAHGDANWLAVKAVAEACKAAQIDPKKLRRLVDARRENERERANEAWRR